MKKYPGFKQFMASDFKSYPGHLVQKTKGPPGASFYDKDGSIIQRYDWSKAQPPQIREHLANHGINPQ
ncbi:MAG: hypothetical protein Q8P67_07495 [archaeon]|nr:hypothetical protein [archaeon]